VKLFVETEYVPEIAALVCRRRARARDETAPWAVHVLSLEGRPQGPWNGRRTARASSDAAAAPKIRKPSTDAR
jgi:hypothetical protein